MGMFTYRTIECPKIKSKEKTIVSIYVDKLRGCKVTHEATLLHPNGKHWITGQYDGYGRLNGYDIFAYVIGDPENYDDQDRDKFFANYAENEKLLKFIETKALKHNPVWHELPPSKPCVSQGFIELSRIEWQVNQHL